MSLHFNTRNTLLQKVKNQYDESAWQDFCKYYTPYIKILLKRLDADSTDVDDITQLVLLQLWKDLPSFDYEQGKGKFRSWLSVMVRNQAYTYFRKRTALKKKHDHFESFLLKDSQKSEYEKIVEDEWQNYMTRLAWDNISECFNEETLQVFKLALSGKSNKEIALSEGLKENTVSVYKKRVKLVLHKEIIKLNDELS